MTCSTPRARRHRTTRPCFGSSLGQARISGSRCSRLSTETVGFGSTFREDGSPVRMGDTITPQQAVARTLAHIQKDERGIKACVTAPVHQAEYDTLLDFSYQYGVVATCSSSMVRNVNAGRYADACKSYLLYKFAAGYDCSTPGKCRCSGVWKRSQERHAACMAAQ
ncbi:MAG: lysozyme [Comamonadaceae bacterium]|nr:MAG: lysozyme [Comamonadaceae bacterium]